MGSSTGTRSVAALALSLSLAPGLVDALSYVVRERVESDVVSFVCTPTPVLHRHLRRAEATRTYSRAPLYPLAPAALTAPALSRPPRLSTTITNENEKRRNKRNTKPPRLTSTNGWLQGLDLDVPLNTTINANECLVAAVNFTSPKDGLYSSLEVDSHHCRTTPPRRHATMPPNHQTTIPPFHHTTVPRFHTTTASPHHRATTTQINLWETSAPNQGSNLKYIALGSQWFGSVQLLNDPAAFDQCDDQFDSDTCWSNFKNIGEMLSLTKLHDARTGGEICVGVGVGVGVGVERGLA